MLNKLNTKIPTKNEIGNKLKFTIFAITWSILLWIFNLLFTVDMLINIVKNNLISIVFTFLTLFGYIIYYVFKHNKESNVKFDEVSNATKKLDDLKNEQSESLKLINSDVSKIRKYSDVFIKEHKKIKHHISWQNKIYQNGSNLDFLWLLLKNEYMAIEKDNIENNKIITSIKYYPYIVKSILDYFLLNDATGKANVKLVSTMLPEHFFNFPSHIKGNQKLCYFKQEFVDEYRENLEKFIKKFKNKFPNDIDSFQRYTLVSENNAFSKNLNDLFSKAELDYSKRLYKENNYRLGFYSKNTDEKYHLENFKKNENIQAYILSAKKTHGSKSVSSYFVDNFHLSSETSYISSLNENDLNSLKGFYDFMIIETNNKKIYIKASISLENETVVIEPIAETDELDNVFNIINSPRNTMSLKEFFKNDK